MQNVTDANFSQVLAAPRAIVDFWSPSCPHCVTFKPIYESVAAQMGDQILMAAADVDQAPQSAGQYHVQSLPTVVFLENGKEVHRIEGGMSQQDFLAEISRAFSGAPQGAYAAAGSAGGGGITPVAAVLGTVLFVGLVGGTVYLLSRK
jgi:thioredoxin 1